MNKRVEQMNHCLWHRDDSEEAEEKHQRFERSAGASHQHA